jgi:hypothetical protein
LYMRLSRVQQSNTTHLLPCSSKYAARRTYQMTAALTGF